MSRLVEVLIKNARAHTRLARKPRVHQILDVVQNSSFYPRTMDLKIDEKLPAQATTPSSSEYTERRGFRLADVLISATTGLGPHKKAAHRRTLGIYATAYVLGLYCFFRFDDPRLRAAALGLLFPGAGLIAVGTIPAIVSFVIVLIVFPITLFLWFACAALAFPAICWLVGTLLAALLARDTLFEAAALLWAVGAVVGVLVIRRINLSASAEAATRRNQRNGWLQEQVKEDQDNASPPAEPGIRELDLRTLRFVQYAVELGLLAPDDWSGHTTIDQFQTAALRYQLHQLVYTLQAYQCHYVPNYSGVVGEACVNALTKLQSKKVNSFWKWECMWGQLNFTDWNPIRKDNIMVTGYAALALALYDGNTRDHRFREKDCMEFVVTNKRRYKTDFPGIVNAVFENMTQCRYTLYPCEPNWIYTPCNLFAITGVVAADRALATDYSEKIRTRFTRALEEEFSELDGTILPVRSKVTGFTIPGAVGAVWDSTTSVVCGPFLPHLAHRSWALVHREAFAKDKDGKTTILLKDGDKMDPGNYKKSEGVARIICGEAAGEHGNQKLRNDMLDQLDNTYHPVERTSSGALQNTGLSTYMKLRAVQMRLLDSTRDWYKMMTEGVPDVCFSGPLLAKVPFPQVLVGKAWSHDGEGLELVLYNGSEAGEFFLDLERLTPSARYKLGDTDEAFEADEAGKARISARIDGRTHITFSRL